MKKTFTKIIASFLAITLVFSIGVIGLSTSAISVSENFYTTDGVSGFNYKINNGEIEIGEIAIIGDFIIPESIDGYPVTSVKGSSEFICKNVYIPATVRTFFAAYNPEKYIVDEDNPYYSSDEHGVLFDKNKETLIFYPWGSTAEKYVVPDSVKYISESAFECCFFLKEVVLNEGLLEIAEYAFADSYGIKKVEISSTVNKIHNSAFYHCKNLEFISVDEDNDYYSNDEYGALFDKNKTKIYKYPSSAPYESYVIPDSVTQKYFEWYGPTLRAFEDLKYLKEITIPASMEDLSSYGFSFFEKINVSPDNPYYTSVDGVVYSKDGTVLKRYPGASKDTCFKFNENVTEAEWTNGYSGFNNINTTYLASVVYNDALSEYVTPIDDGEELYCYHKALSDVYYMGDGEAFERTAKDNNNGKTITFHYNCKPDDHFHDYEIEITAEATCGNSGEAILTCSCGKIITVEIDNTDLHTVGDGYEEFDNYVCCKAVKYDAVKCEDCDYTPTLKLKEFPSDISMTVSITPATEEENGIARQLCEECGGQIGWLYLNYGNRIMIIRSNGIDMIRDYAPGEEIKIKYEPQKENSVFVGWVDREGNFVEFPEIMPDEDVYLEAVFENASYNVTYVNDGETVGETQVKYGDTVDLSFEPEKLGYNFIGWAYNGELVDEAFAMPGFDIILEAVWEAKEYTVTYTVASETVEKNYAYGEEINSEIQIPEGYEFVKWTDENGVDAEIPETMPAEDLVFVAKLNAIRNNPLFDVHASFDDDCFGDKTGEVIMKVENTSSTADKGAVYVTEGVNYHQVASYQITMVTVEGENEEIIQPVNGKKVKIRIPIPENYTENNTFEIIHRYSDKGREPITPVVVDGYLEFYTGHFSTFEVYVAAGLSVSAKPHNTNVTYKGKLNLDGIELTYINDNGEVIKVTDTSEITVKNFDSSKIGTQTVTVEYAGETAEIEVTVSYAWWQWIIRIFLLGFIWY